MNGSDWSLDVPIGNDVATLVRKWRRSGEGTESGDVRFIEV